MKNEKHFALMLGATCLGIYGFALVMQELLGFTPCRLCHYERWLYVAVGVIAFLGLLLSTIPIRAVLIICLIILVGNAFLSAYHVGVQEGVFAPPLVCSSTPTSHLSVQDLREQLLQTSMARCDKVDWSFLGISLAGYNVILSLGLSLITFAVIRQSKES